MQCRVICNNSVITIKNIKFLWLLLYVYSSWYNYSLLINEVIPFQNCKIGCMYKTLFTNLITYTDIHTHTHCCYLCSNLHTNIPHVMCDAIFRKRNCKTLKLLQYQNQSKYAYPFWLFRLSIPTLSYVIAKVDFVYQMPSNENLLLIQHATAGKLKCY